MYVASAVLTFYIPYANSLKDKRQVRRSVIQKAQHKFNASIAEVDTQDVSRTLTIGVAVVSGENAHAQHSLDALIHFMEEHAEAELVKIETRN
ncbi:MAG: DUF503 domain-containing protein [Turicibacter sp.]|nr:DUF503 domain-containing protein [Turicibacter sp.]